MSFQPSRPKIAYGAKAVGSFVPRLTRKAFEKYGFSAATLITDWAAIAGPELAAFTAPERIRWPRTAQQDADEVGAAEKSRRPGATLVLRVDGARSLDVQYGARQLIERINAYFGYAAVAELRIVQAPVVAALQHGSDRVRVATQPLSKEVAGVADPALRHALGCLGAGIRAGRP